MLAGSISAGNSSTNRAAPVAFTCNSSPTSSTRSALRRAGTINPLYDLALLPFYDLDAVAERIAHVGAVVTLERFVINNREPGAAARLHDCFESLDQQSRMRFGRRPEVLVDTQVDPHDVVAEPASATFRKVEGLRQLGQFQHISIEAAGQLLSACRHRELDVIDSNDRHDPP